MNSSSTFILPDALLADQRSKIDELLDLTALLLQENGLKGFLDPLMEIHLKATFETIGAHEGTLWLLSPDEAYLRPQYNTGPEAEKMLREVRQDTSKGIISMVLALGTTHHSDRTYEETKHDKMVDRTLGSVTCSMVAVPFDFAGRRRGVLSAVTLKPSIADPNPNPIPTSAATTLCVNAAILGRLFDHRLFGLLAGAVGN